MKEVRCLVIDDEPLAIEVIKAHLSRVPQFTVVGTCNNAIEALDFLRTQSVDLLFLDIQMPFLTGMEFLRSLSHPPEVIFTTAYRDYALESYELNALDYLLKPISFERFFKAIHKYLSLSAPVRPSAQVEVSVGGEETIDFNSNKKTYRIRLQEIEYIESLKDYIQVHVEGQTISSKLKISEVAETLPPYFLRIHRSYIVNTKAITAFSTYEVELGKTTLPIGSSYKQQVQQVLRGE